MRYNGKLEAPFVVFFCIVAFSSVADADSFVPDSGLPAAAGSYVKDPRVLKLPSNDDSQLFTPSRYWLASSDDGPPAGQGDAASPVAVKPALISGRKVHQYLGLGTLALFGLTAATAPDGERNNTNRQNSGVHHSLGIATAAMAASTVASGLLVHWDDFHFEDGFGDPDNLHVMLAGAGTLAMLYAVSVAPAHSHSAAGVAGGAAMIVAVKLTW